MMHFLSFAVIVNVFLFYSIFDLYFKSPIVSVGEHFRLKNKTVSKAPFKRVEFFTADGLRAETFINHPQRRPYMTELMKMQSSVWGVSHTRVPTESRPAHVALFAGFFEDPSAVLTWFKENSAEFDTVFDHCTKSVAVGTRGIIKLLSKGNAGKKMTTAILPSIYQDFLGKNLTELNSWVFERLSGMIQREELPKSEETIVFLHFMAMDTIGQESKPESEAYIKSMEHLDGLVERSEKMINNYYRDKDTLFILTSDHGMTNWGTHGDGSAHETETPFLVWGKGIRKAALEQQILKQIDFAALIAGALGISFPSNSQGRFPFHIWDDQKFAFEALTENFLQLRRLMLTKKELVQSQRNFPLVEFPKEHIIQANFWKYNVYENTSNFSDRLQILNDTLLMTLEGVMYYERYDNQLLTGFSVFTQVTWIVIVAFIIINMDCCYANIKTRPFFSFQYATISLIVAILFIRVAIGWSLWRLPYGFFPAYLVIVFERFVLRGDKASDSKFNVNRLFLLLAFCAIGVEVLVNGFHHRGVLSFGLVLNGLWCIHANKVGTHQKFLFLVAIAALAIFPALPVIGKQRDPYFMSLGPLVSTGLIGFLLYLRNKQSSTSSARRNRVVLTAQLVLLLLASVLCHFPTLFYTRYIAWASLLQPYFFPIFTSTETVFGRLLSVFLAIASPYFFTSYSYEGCFFPCLFLMLVILLKTEISDENQGDSWSDFLNLNTKYMEQRKVCENVSLYHAVRRAWLHLFFVTLSFFGTGNIASVRSFLFGSTRCFVRGYDPWIMMLVLTQKFMGPFLLISCFFRRLLWSNLQIERNFLIVLLLCQGMGLHTFFMVKNRGSWLEMGTSITHHVIASATTLCLFILHFIAGFLTSYEPWFFK